MEKGGKGNKEGTAIGDPADGPGSETERFQAIVDVKAQRGGHRRVGCPPHPARPRAALPAQVARRVFVVLAAAPAAAPAAPQSRVEYGVEVGLICQEAEDDYARAGENLIKRTGPELSSSFFDQFLDVFERTIDQIATVPAPPGDEALVRRLDPRGAKRQGHRIRRMRRLVPPALLAGALLAGFAASPAFGSQPLAPSTRSRSTSSARRLKATSTKAFARPLQSAGAASGRSSPRSSIAPTTSSEQHGSPNIAAVPPAPGDEALASELA